MCCRTLLLLSALLIGCSPEHEIITSCEDQPGIRTVCAFQNPEDLADPGGGRRVVPGTEAPFPNGIELSADEREIFLNVYATGEVRRISRETGELLAMAEISRPDNSSWSSDGRLLVASHVGGMADQMQCQDLVSGACPLAFEIVSLDPISLEGSVVFANAGEPMGAGTVALDLGDELVIGSFSGDRIIRVGR